LLRQHIHVEDHELYPLVRTVLDGRGMQALEKEFDRTREKHGSSAFERAHRLVVDKGSILVHLH
jgi:hemerythrin-like domain-containing protein